MTPYDWSTSSNDEPMFPVRDEKEIVSICGWCENAKAETQRLVAEGKRVSHGMCADCQRRMEER